MLSNYNIANIPAISYVVAVAHDTVTVVVVIKIVIVDNSFNKLVFLII